MSHEDPGALGRLLRGGLFASSDFDGPPPAPREQPRGAVRRIGHYEVRAQLGQGGMGSVLLAHDPYLGRDVAIKLLHGQAARSAVARERFVREARALARLRHPNVIPVLAAGEHEGTLYVVMELITGESLEERLRRTGPLAPDEAVGLVRKLAHGLEHAHLHGILHRDVKPANVLLDARTGEPLLTDFGLAGEVQPVEQGRLTETDGLMGTPGWWSPEQAGGGRDRIGPATDVYGLGATLYGALTGTPPIQAQSLLEHVSIVGHARPRPPEELAPAVEPWLSAVCLRCLEKDPAARYPSAAALSEALAPPPRGRRGPRAHLRVVALAALACCALALQTLQRRSTGAAPTPDAQPLPAPPSSDAPSIAATPSADSPPAGDRVRAPEVEAALARARDLCAEGAHRAARDLLSTLVGAHASDAEAWRLRAVEHAHLGELQASLSDFDAALELRPTDAAALSGRAEVRLALKQPARAEADLQAALALDPTDAGACLALAKLYAEARRPREVLGLVERVLASKPDALVARLLRAQARQDAQVRDYAGAESDYRALLADVDRGVAPAAMAQQRASLHYNLGNALFAQGRLTAAIDSYSRAIDVAPGHASAYYNRGNAHLARGESEAAVVDYTRAIALRRQDPDPDLFENRSTARCAVGDALGALEDAQAANALRPRAESQCLAGIALERLDRQAEALDRYADAIRRAPASWCGWRHRGELRLSLGEHQAALDDLQRARKEGAAADILLPIARARAGLGDAPEARRLVEALIAELERRLTSETAGRDEAARLEDEARGRLLDQARLLLDQLRGGR